MERPASTNRGGLSVEDVESRAMTRRRRSRGCCSGCNCQIFCSYVLALISTSLVVGGVYLSLVQWDRIWLMFSVAGLIFTIIGSCMYYCGTQSLAKEYESDDDSYRRRRRQKHRRGQYRDRGLSGDELVPSAPSGDRSVSQLSLNMIPQYFARADTTNSGNHSNAMPSAPTAPNGMAHSQIFSVNGQSFLILPLTGNASAFSPADANHLNGLVVKLPIDGDDDVLRKYSASEFLSKLDPKANNLASSKPERENQTDDNLVSLQSLDGRSDYFKALRAPPPSESNVAPLAASSSSQMQERLSVQSSANPMHIHTVTSENTATGAPLNSTSFFVSFAPDALSSGLASGPSSSGGVRSSLRRTGTFKQTNPTVLAPSTSSSSAPPNPVSSSQSANSSALIELTDALPSTSRAATSSHHVDELLAMGGDDVSLEGDLDDTIECTPPPSYAEVLEDTQQLHSLNTNRGHSNEACGTL